MVAALFVPFGFALSVESDQAVTMTPPALIAASAAITVPLALPATPNGPADLPPSVPEAAKLFGVGTVLFGLAAAVRKAV